MLIEVVGMLGTESSVGDVQDIEAERPQAKGPAVGGAEEEVGGLRVFVDECEVAGTEVVDGGSSIFFVVVAVAALAPCIVIGSSRTRCTRSRTASLRATSASMDNGRFEVGEGWGFCVMSVGGAGHLRGRRCWLLLRFWSPINFPVRGLRGGTRQIQWKHTRQRRSTIPCRLF
jgi:hypothetical protein